jgi:hypothetical protein
MVLPARAISPAVHPGPDSILNKLLEDKLACARLLDPSLKLLPSFRIQPPGHDDFGTGEDLPVGQKRRRKFIHNWSPYDQGESPKKKLRRLRGGDDYLEEYVKINADFEIGR